ncbi:uncharacterized protein ASPGLDRAFT_45663 [Aspergillus glaucus CBS 516.65]|uniref:Uncharacterized protein n=1 Tax=Aspergillus glaucus CBS 516.65 TaxID=1160497 RepID=A0A1L9VP55_ASPGL|nr:hypothetical protein ASPGLDRAFT_45663 [Aspergillus glaucus CBS 516.65]OJJ85672.1 hypothetical protein ASPGLDRAFT_45663 [Aspergillus glaucus CBS 516.65]
MSEARPRCTPFQPPDWLVTHGAALFSALPFYSRRLCYWSPQPTRGILCAGPSTPYI